MAKKKAKWLEEATVASLLIIIQEGLNNLDDEKAVQKASKAVEEVIERQPVEAEGTPSVEEALAALKESTEAGLANVEAAYKAELEAMDAEADDEDPEETTEDDDDDDDDDEDEGEDTPDYSEMGQKQLKEMCRERGIKVKKGMKKSDFIKLLEADDKE